MADFAPLRRASLLRGGRPAIMAFVQYIEWVLAKLNRKACTSRQHVEEAEWLLKLSDRDLNDIGLRRSDIHAYILDRTNR